jgi:hypothetical protein
VKFKKQILKYATGNLITSELPEIGIMGLEEGFDTPSLRILAGLSTTENPFVIEQYFKVALDEIQISLPDKRQAAIEYGYAIVDEIMEGKRGIFEGTKEIRYKAIDSYDFFSESQKYCYDSIGFEKAYALYDTIDELLHADRQWSDEKTNEELISEVKQELFNELKRWRNHNTAYNISFKQ